MSERKCKTIVLSAVNLVDGGTFTILQQCLEYLANSSSLCDYRVVALVNNSKNLPQERIEYIEFPKAKKNYFYRFYYEYYAFMRLSKQLRPALWLSLHDMSPIVKADVQAVYMHNAIVFYKPKLRDWKFVPINALWSYLYKYIYRINIHSNTYLCVQQKWLRDEFSRMFLFPKERIIVARPNYNDTDSIKMSKKGDTFTFVYPAYPRVFKNFDVICKASQILESKGVNNFLVRLTIDGSENKYSEYLVRKYSKLKTIDFCGLIPKSRMPEYYSESDCLLFTSKLETWGLPLSEYRVYNRPIIVSDLPYAYESCEGSQCTCFVDPDNANALAEEMLRLISGNMESFKCVMKKSVDNPYATSWNELFNILLNQIR